MTKKKTPPFEQMVAEWIVSKGAVPHKDGYALRTPAGELRIYPYEDWIACRFEDVAAGASYTTQHSSQLSNPHSGKWNFNGRSTTVVFNEFSRELLKLLKSNERMTPLQALMVCHDIAWRGFEYVFLERSSYPGIRDKRFHALRIPYVCGDKSVEPELRKYILECAGRKNFRLPGQCAWNKYSPQELAAEDERWRQALTKDMNYHLYVAWDRLPPETREQHFPKGRPDAPVPP